MLSLRKKSHSVSQIVSQSDRQSLLSDAHVARKSCLLSPKVIVITSFSCYYVGSNVIQCSLRQESFFLMGFWDTVSADGIFSGIKFTWTSWYLHTLLFIRIIYLYNFSLFNVHESNGSLRLFGGLNLRRNLISKWKFYVNYLEVRLFNILLFCWEFFDYVT